VARHSSSPQTLVARSKAPPEARRGQRSHVSLQRNGNALACWLSHGMCGKPTNVSQCGNTRDNAAAQNDHRATTRRQHTRPKSSSRCTVRYLLNRESRSCGAGSWGGAGQQFGPRRNSVIPKAVSSVQHAHHGVRLYVCACACMGRVIFVSEACVVVGWTCMLAQCADESTPLAIHAALSSPRSRGRQAHAPLSQGEWRAPLERLMLQPG
jgi:hypothetical protein